MDAGLSRRLLALGNSNVAARPNAPPLTRAALSTLDGEKTKFLSISIEGKGFISRRLLAYHPKTGR